MPTEFPAYIYIYIHIPDYPPLYPLYERKAIIQCRKKVTFYIEQQIYYKSILNNFLTEEGFFFLVSFHFSRNETFVRTGSYEKVIEHQNIYILL